MQHQFKEKYVLGSSGFTYHSQPSLNSKVILKCKFQEVDEDYMIQSYQIVDFQTQNILVTGFAKIVPFDFHSQTRCKISQKSKESMKIFEIKSKL
jgi:acyl-CoA thioesterase FadM